jgi:hypothetical protein
LASQTFRVEVTGLDDLRARLSSRRLFGPVKEELIQRAAEEAHRIAAEKSKGRYGRKGFRNHLRTTFYDDGMIARVGISGAVVGIANTIEEGRRPGKRPPYRGIKAWALQAGIISGARGDSKKVREIREDIKDRGTSGIHFLRQAQEHAENVIKQRIPSTERDIERKFG